jgi:peptide/nickel transport system ATP-binding protein
MSELTGSKTVTKEDTILRINNLHTYFYTDIGVSKALNGVTLDIPAGKVMGVVGESGCG